MKITARLAYSQIKANRSRTIWTLIGIILSTALITVVCSFAASGNALLVDLYGESYSESGGKITALLLIPVVILSLIIVSMAVIVISNAFQVSASERTMQFGILKSVGGTKQQITATVMYESIFLSVVGIPIGLIMGLILTFAGVQVANYYLEGINKLVRLMMDEMTFGIDFVIAWQAILIAFLISFFAVLLSAWLPAKKAAKISAIDSIRKVSEVKVETKQIRTSRLTRKLFGFEGTLAAKNMKRSKRNLRASVISLTVGIVLFINISAISSQLNTISEIMFSSSDADVMVDYSSSYDTIVNNATGREEYKLHVPIDNKIAEAITAKLRGYKGAAVFGMGNDMDTYTASVSNKMITTEMKEAVYSTVNTQTYEMPVEIITVDSENYASLCEQAGVPIGSNILVNYYNHNDNGKAVAIEPLHFEGQSLQLMKADGSTDEITIQGELTQENMPNEFLYPNMHMIRIIAPQGEVRNYGWIVKTKDIEGFMDYANVIMSESFPRTQESTYMELGFTTRVYEMQDYMRVMNIAIGLVMVFVYSFVALLTLIGLTNVISTMSTNVKMRSREFAVLQSVGLTPDGLKRMLNLESMMCSAKSLIVGLPLGLILTYIINIPIRAAYPIPYQFPWLAVLCCIVTVVAITWSTMRYASTRLRKKSIIEEIRL